MGDIKVGDLIEPWFWKRFGIVLAVKSSPCGLRVRVLFVDGKVRWLNKSEMEKVQDG